MKAVIPNLLIWAVLFGCGPAQPEPPVKDGKYSFAKAKADCTGCHASAAFLASESAFKTSAQVKDLVQGKKMLKNKPYDDQTIEAFLQYIGE